MRREKGRSRDRWVRRRKRRSGLEEGFIIHALILPDAMCPSLRQFKLG